MILLICCSKSPHNKPINKSSNSPAVLYIIIIAAIFYLFVILPFRTKDKDITIDKNINEISIANGKGINQNISKETNKDISKGITINNSSNKLIEILEKTVADKNKIIENLEKELNRKNGENQLLNNINPLQKTL
jgi:hypothetical protein